MSQPTSSTVTPSPPLRPAEGPQVPSNVIGTTTAANTSTPALASGSSSSLHSNPGVAGNAAIPPLNSSASASSSNSSVVSSSASSPNLGATHASPPKVSRKTSIVEKINPSLFGDKLFSELRRSSSSASALSPNPNSSSAPGSANASMSNIPETEIPFSNTEDDYELGSAIGYGSSATVFIAKHKPTGKNVAIKTIDLDMFERNQIDELRREIQIMSLCKHPQLLTVYGSFVRGSKLWIITPYLSAGSCLDIMKTAFPDGLDEVSIATILKQSLQGLEYLHKNGLIHRDVKAGNLLMAEDGLVQLADFGVSATLMDGGERKGVRKTFVGTPCWMAPEVMEQSGYDYKADIWSFGITSLELATGHAPFARYPPIKVLMLTLQNDPPTLDRDNTKHKYSKTFKEMIDSCLQKDPAKRPTAEKLLQHPFFKQAKKRDHLIRNVLMGLPSVEKRGHHKKTQQPKPTAPKGVSWDFDDDATPSEEQAPKSVSFAMEQRNSIDESAEFGTPDSSGGQQNGRRHVSFALSDSGSGQQFESGHASLDRETSSAGSTVSSSNPGLVASAGGAKKSRFIVDGNSNNEQVPLSATSSGSGGSTLSGNNSAAAAAANEIRKGRFSVMDGSGNGNDGQQQQQQQSSTTSSLPGSVPGSQPDSGPGTLERARRGRFEVSSSMTSPMMEDMLQNPSLQRRVPSTTMLSGMHMNALQQQSSSPMMQPSSTFSSMSSSGLSPEMLAERMESLLRAHDQQRGVINDMLRMMSISGGSGASMGHHGNLSSAPGSPPMVPTKGHSTNPSISSSITTPTLNSNSPYLGHHRNFSGESVGSGGIATEIGTGLSTIERQIQMVVRDNEALRNQNTGLLRDMDTLRRENEALKMELNRMRGV